MDVCQNKIPTSDDGSPQQPDGTGHPVQQNLPPPSSERRQSPFLNPYPETCTQNIGPEKSGMKRKYDDEEETLSETLHLSKRAKSVNIRACSAVRSPPAQSPHPNAHPSKSSHNQSCTRPGNKRKVDSEDEEETLSETLLLSKRAKSGWQR